MQSTIFAHDLLQYDVQHRVLICRECKYAIQKSALGSHLLRHKIYRGERRRLLSSIAQCLILEPDDVQTPPVGSAPVDGLPIISGYRCLAAGCGSLCASSKRMRRHWSEDHGIRDPPDSFARVASLQTFFRGTKTRYFEVALPSDAAGESPFAGNARLSPRPGLDVVATHAPCAQAPGLCSSLLRDPDLESLNYFHHFLTTTSLTLPSRRHGTANYWQTEVVTQALKLRWLMCGLLAISTSHLAALSADGTEKRIYLDRSERLLGEFHAGWETTKRGSAMAESDEVEIGSQVICIQRCYLWASNRPLLGQAVTQDFPPFHLRSFVATVQGCVDPSFALRFAVISDELPGETIIRTRNSLEDSDVAGVLGHAPLALLGRLRTLPYRMAEVLDKPESAMDFFATASAIELLIECCSISYASDDARATWMGMELWLRRLSHYFNRMLWRQNSAALIVLAHWSLLVARAERHFWILQGLATEVQRQVTAGLPRDGNIQRLVENLVV